MSNQEDITLTAVPGVQMFLEKMILEAKGDRMNPVGIAMSAPDYYRLCAELESKFQMVRTLRREFSFQGYPIHICSSPIVELLFSPDDASQILWKQKELLRKQPTGAKG